MKCKYDCVECFFDMNECSKCPTGLAKIDTVKHPSHYTSVVPGIECIDVAQWFSYCRGAAIKYLWRAGLKDKSKEIEDLEKAKQYIDFEIKRLKSL